MRSALSPSFRSSTFPPPRSSTKWSGLTAPETMASPRPGLASITSSVRRPVTGLAVNITPATAASSLRCTATARCTARCWMPRWARYTTARSVNSEDQHSRTASSSAFSPTTLSSVSCCPANDASGRSSAVADERTATGGSSPPSPRYASAHAARTGSGTSAWSSASRARSASFDSTATSVPFTPSSSSSTAPRLLCRTASW